MIGDYGTIVFLKIINNAAEKGVGRKLVANAAVEMVTAGSLLFP